MTIKVNDVIQLKHNYSKNRSIYKTNKLNLKKKDKKMLNYLSDFFIQIRGGAIKKKLSKNIKFPSGFSIKKCFEEQLFK